MTKSTCLKIRVNNIAIIQYLLIYIMIQYIGGRVQAFLGADLFYGMSILLCVIMVLIFSQNALQKDFLVFLIITLFSMGCTFLLTNGALGIGTILSVISRFLLVYTAIKIDLLNFLERFLKIVFLMAITSLCIFLFVQILGFSTAEVLFSHLYEIKNENFWLGSSYGLFFICYNFMDPARNAYMFGEPGEYQSLLITAIYFLTFFQTKIKDKAKYYIIFIVTLLTVQSTTGFLNFLVYLVIVLLFLRQRIPATIKRILAIVLAIVIIYAVFFYSTDSFLYTSFAGKIFDSQGNIDFTVGTGAARIGPLNRLVKTLDQMPEKMIFGVGYEGLKNTPLGGYSTGGIINFIAIFGIVTTGIVYGKLIYALYTYNKSAFQICFVLFYLVNMGISQPDILAISVVLMCMYGEYSTQRKIREMYY